MGHFDSVEAIVVSSETETPLSCSRISARKGRNITIIGWPMISEWNFRNQFSKNSKMFTFASSFIIYNVLKVGLSTMIKIEFSTNCRAPENIFCHEDCRNWIKNCGQTLSEVRMSFTHL